MSRTVLVSAAWRIININSFSEQRWASSRSRTRPPPSFSSARIPGRPLALSVSPDGSTRTQTGRGRLNHCSRIRPSQTVLPAPVFPGHKDQPVTGGQKGLDDVHSVGQLGPGEKKWEGLARDKRVLMGARLMYAKNGRDKKPLSPVVRRPLAESIGRQSDGGDRDGVESATPRSLTVSRPRFCLRRQAAPAEAYRRIPGRRRAAAIGSWSLILSKGKKQPNHFHASGKEKRAALGKIRTPLYRVRHGPHGFLAFCRASMAWTTYGYTVLATRAWPAALGWMPSAWLNRGSPPTFSSKKGIRMAWCRLAASG